MKARIKRVVISPEAFMHIMSNDTAWRVQRGIPKGSRLKGATQDPYLNVWNLFIENDSFDEIEIGTEVAPVLETEFIKIP